MASVDERVNEEVRADAHEPDGPPASRPFWLIGLALIGTIGLLFGAALLLDRQLRPVQEAPALPASDARTEPAVRTGVDSASVPTPPALSLEDEIEAGYLHYWKVRSEALFSLNPAQLPEVMAGDELDRERKRIADLSTQGRAARIDVEHKIAFLSVSASAAELYDEYQNQSYLIDAQTKEPVGAPGTGGIARVMFRLEKIGGIWKVVDGSQIE